jgi:hypothetical protein
MFYAERFTAFSTILEGLLIAILFGANALRLTRFTQPHKFAFPVDGGFRATYEPYIFLKAVAAAAAGRGVARP